MTDSSFETIITGLRARKRSNEHKFSREQVTHVPGGFNDPIRQMQTLPGVAMLPLLNGQLIVRGTRAGDTAFLIDGMPIPYVFHFGSGFGPSVFPSLLVESITFTPSLASPRYGGMLGGTVELKTRDRFEPYVHGYAALDLLSAQAFLYVAPTPNLAFEGSVRRSYIEAIAAPIIPLARDRIPAVIPYFTDYQAHAAARFGRAGHFDLWFYGSDDGFSLVGGNAFAGQVKQLESFLQKTSFNALKPRWRLKLGDRFEHELSVLLANVVTQSAPAHSQWQLAIRDELLVRFHAKNTLRVGVDAFSVWQTFADQPGLGMLIVPSRHESHRVALYLDADLTFGRFDLRGGMRLTYWQLGLAFNIPQAVLIPGAALPSPGDPPGPQATVRLQPVVSQTLEPRLTLGVRVHDTVRLSLGSGFYTAPLPMQSWLAAVGPSLRAQLTSFSDPGGVSITANSAVLQRLEQNWQSVASMGWQPLPWLSVEVNGFLNLMHDVTSFRLFGPPVPSELARRGDRRAYGVEVFVRTPGIKGFSGWVSYTLSRTEDIRDNQAVVSDYSQTHVLGLSLSYALPHAINLGLRFRIGSGWPVTPIVASRFDLASDLYYGEVGPRNSGRTPPVHQLDLRIDKTFRFKGWSFAMYLEVMNVYAQKNPEYDYLAWDFSAIRYISVIPILPMLGISAEF